MYWRITIPSHHGELWVLFVLPLDDLNQPLYMFVRSGLGQLFLGPYYFVKQNKTSLCTVLLFCLVLFFHHIGWLYGTVNLL